MAFTFDPGNIALPQGAWARTQRRYLRNDGRLVLGLTQGDFRNYVFPLFTPAGHLVTSEAPADHPHHQSLWLGADHVHALVPASEGGIEEYTYNFYLNDVFQGRAPGRIVERACTFEDGADGGAIIRQELDWQGPVEWARPDGAADPARDARAVVEQTARGDGAAHPLDPAARPVAGAPGTHAPRLLQRPRRRVDADAGRRPRAATSAATRSGPRRRPPPNGSTTSVRSGRAARPGSR